MKNRKSTQTIMCMFISMLNIKCQQIFFSLFNYIQATTSYVYSNYHMKGINYSDYIDVNSNTINITYPNY